MRSAREIIESIQEQAYAESGLDPDKARSFGLSASEDSVPVTYFDKLLHDISQRNDITRFQDPVSISVILECWELVQAANQEDTSHIEDPQAHPSKVLLATAPTGDLNARAIRGNDGSKGILFEIDLQLWLIKLARRIEELLITQTESRIEIRHPKDPEAFSGKEDAFDRLTEQFVSAATQGKSDTPFLPFESSEEKKLFELIYKGAVTFVLGHELAHLTRNHHTKKGGYWIPKNVRETWLQYEEVYANQYPGISIEDAFTTLARQGREYEADYYGYLYTSNTFLLHPALQMMMQNHDGIEACPSNFNIFFVGLGAELFLWSIEYLERTIRTLQAGHDGTSSGIFSKDFGVQDIVCRATHPCPHSRLAMVNQGFKLSAAAADFLNSLFDAFWRRAYPRLQDLHKLGVRPHERWLAPSTDIAAQLKCLQLS